MRPGDMKVTCRRKRQAELNHSGRKLKWLSAERRLDGDGPDEADVTQDNKDAPFSGTNGPAEGASLCGTFATAYRLRSGRNERLADEITCRKITANIASLKSRHTQ